MLEANRELDASGLNCPLPILRTKKSMAELAPGEVLKIKATDPGSVKDMEAFCLQTGNKLLQSSEEGQHYTFFVKKA